MKTEKNKIYSIKVEEKLVNKVAQSGLISLDLEQYAPTEDIVELDIKSQLFQELLLREKDFREWVKTNDWTAYARKHVALHCSTDAIIPAWAWALVACELAAQEAQVSLCSADELKARLWDAAIRKQVQAADYTDARVILKGCGTVPPTAYTLAAHILRPVVRSLMFGEPCSTVPIYKKPLKK